MLMFSPSSTASRCLRGFTLVEMLAALVLLSLMAAVVLPSMERWYTSLDSRAERARIVAQAQQLMVRAAVLGQPLVIDATSQNQLLKDREPALRLPAGWVMAAGTVWRISALGVCVPTTLRFERTQAGTGAALNSVSAVIELQVMAGSCELRPVEAKA